jgi:hypothetical protein
MGPLTLDSVLVDTGRYPSVFDVMRDIHGITDE